MCVLQNKQLVEDIFDDFILCFFGRKEEMDNSFWRKYFLFGDEVFAGLKEAFPEGESAGVVVYVSDLYAERIKNNEHIDHIMPSEDGWVFYKNKAIIQLVEEE